METISDISQTATLEVKFERSLDQLEAAWDVSGKPNDIPIWEQEERDYQALVAQQDQKRQQQQQQQQRQQRQQNNNGSPITTPTTTITTHKLPSPPSPPICEVLAMSFLFVSRLHSYVLHNPDELCRVLEDHVVTTIKLSASPYALPFEQRVKELRARQDSLLEWVFVWMEMQRTWLELKPLHLQGKLKIKTKLQELFVKCDLKIKKILNKWYAEHMYNYEPYSPSPHAVISTSKIISKISTLNGHLQHIYKELTTHLQESYWLTSPRTRWLSMEQCFQLNALEYYPDTIDAVVPLLFPGARRWLLEQEKSLQQLEDEEEDMESDDTAEEDEDEENNNMKNKNKNEGEEGEVEEDEDLSTVVSGQHFRNLMKEVHVLPPSTLCGFGCVNHHNTLHGKDAFHFTTPVQLFTTGGKQGTTTTVINPASGDTVECHTRQPRPLPLWLNEAVVQMRVSLLERVTLAYEACR